MRKSAFFELFARRSSKSVRKQLFSLFSRHFEQSSQKMRKTAFFELFALIKFRQKCEKFAKNAKKQRFLSFLRDVPQKVWETVFFHVFRDTLYKLRIICEKTSVFWAFCATILKKCEKQCFFTFFETVCTKFAKNAKKTAYLSFCATFLNKCEKRVFHVFRDALYKVHKKREKTAFFELFALSFAKSVRKQRFLTFFETLCTKFAKNAKKQRFLTFLR